MPRFAANLSMMFTEWEFLDRFKAAAEAGFEAVEFLFPYEHTPEQVGLALAGGGLTQALYNLPPGDFARGERGIASLAGREDEFRASVETALSYVHETGVKRLHMMAGLADPNDPVAQKTYRASLAYAADKLGEQGIDLLLEPINGKGHAGLFPQRFRSGGGLCSRIRPAECPFAIRHVSLRIDPWRRLGTTEGALSARRPCPDRPRQRPA